MVSVARNPTSRHHARTGLPLRTTGHTVGDEDERQAVPHIIEQPPASAPDDARDGGDHRSARRGAAVDPRAVLDTEVLFFAATGSTIATRAVRTSS
jgi:hypothetical protein